MMGGMEVEILKKLEALRTLGFNYIGYDDKVKSFKAIDDVNKEGKCWSINLQGFDELKDLIPSVNELYKIERLEKFLRVQLNIKDTDKGV